MKKTIKTNELIYLNEAAKALKSKTFQILNNVIIGINNIDSYITFVELDTDVFYNLSINNLIINSRDLSAFIKTIMLESEFELEECNDRYTIHTMNGELKLISRFDIKDSYNINSYDRLRYAKYNIDMRTPLSNEKLINDNIQDLFNLRKDDGCIYYIHEGKYFMTLFSGILPINKSDKVYLTIYPSDNNTFIARFRVNKKRFNVFIYLAYLFL